jgi:Mg-chelatase subunit ChlD
VVFPIAFARPWYLLLLLVLGPVAWLWCRTARRSSRRAWASLIVRGVVIALIVLAAAGLEWQRAGDELVVVFLLDVSDSIGVPAREQGVAFIEASLRAMGPDDRAALVLFGADALVELPLGWLVQRDANEPLSLLSVPDTARTDIGEAIRLGLALAPWTAQRRLVLLSDGRGNVPGAEEAAALAAAEGASLDTALLPTGDAPAEAWIDAVDLPSLLYEGETFSLLAQVRSEVEQRALLRLFGPVPGGTGDGLLAEQSVVLHAGLNAFPFRLTAGQSGFGAFAVQVVPERDTFYRNNMLGAFAEVRGAPQALVVDAPNQEGVDEVANLATALEHAGLRVARMRSPYLPGDLAELGSYAAVMLVDVPASALSDRQMAALQGYVRDLGRGLVCVGGARSYGVGGYFDTPLEEILPVEMTIRDPQRVPPVAIAFAIDKSGSMDMASRASGGVRKVDLAKEAVLRSLELLQPRDQVGVVAFDDAAQWVYPALGPALAGLDDLAAVQERVGTIRAGGGTDIYAGLGAAVAAMERSDAAVKHVILLTDGGASQERLADLVARLRAAGGTLSTVGVGQDAAPFLRTMALDGGGRYHYTDDPSTIPEIFTQETMLAQRAYLVEETFYPALSGRSAILDGIEAVPALHGYVATSIKAAAQEILTSNQGDPVLAQWQYGLGRAVAWTSDATTRWGREWVGWEGFPLFWGQAVRWTIADDQGTGIEAQIADEGERAHVTVDVVDEAGKYRNDLDVTASAIPSLAAVGEAESVTSGTRLRQTAPGRYEGDLALGQGEGVYLVRIDAVGADGGAPLTRLSGFVRPYSPEYRVLGADEAAMRRLAEVGEGRFFRVANMEDTASIAKHSLKRVPARTPVWPWLLAAAVCLLPVDVGLRRVLAGWGDVRRWIELVRAQARGWAARLSGRRAAQPAHTSRLLQAKRRGAAQHARREAPGLGEGGAGTLPQSPHIPPAVPGGELELPAEVDRMPEEKSQGALAARLLAAKRRARREEGDEGSPADPAQR